MSLMTKILMGFVVAAVFPLLYMAAGVLKVNGVWRIKVQQFEKAVATMLPGVRCLNPKPGERASL